MNKKSLSCFSIFGLAAIAAFSLSGCHEKIPEELPNILWLTSEDNSPLLGCYGDSFATTPNLDKLASEGFLYTHAYANAPVCAPARNTIITGIYASSGGNQHMRSYYPKSEIVKTGDPQYAYMFRGRMDERYDMSRAVRDHKFRYIRNYMPFRIYGQHLEYLWRASSIRSWEQAYLKGECNETQSIFWNTKPVEELYDTENDPWEINNLAADPAYADVLERMRAASREWVIRIKDTGFIPEADRIERDGKMPIYDYMRSGKIDLESIIDAAEIATFGKVENLPALQSFLKSNESAIRYWGATGLLILGKEAAPAKSELLSALNEESANVVTVVAEALYNLGEKEAAKEALLSVLENPNICTLPCAECH